MPFFSIVIPVYRTEHFLGECLGSLHRQGFTDFECLIIDDGSPGVEVEGSILSTEQVVAGVCAGDARFQILHQTNTGQGMARQNGIDHAKGKFLVLIDADDYLEDDFLEIAASALQESSPDTLVFNRVVAEVEGVRTPFAATQSFVPTINSLKTALYFPSYTLTPVNYFYDLEIIRRYKVRFRQGRGEDTMFFFDCIFAYFSTNQILPQLQEIPATYVYRIEYKGENSTSQQASFESRLIAGMIWYFSLRWKDFYQWGVVYFVLAGLFLARQKLYQQRQSTSNPFIRLMLNVLVKPLTLIARMVSGAKKQH